MSKRLFPQQQGDRKRAKLDVSISDHNFPLSQNKEPEQTDNWGDDNDDEILLLASQACEEAYSNDVSLLPDYSMCMQPGSTSTQLYFSPSTSKTEFSFKKPSTNPHSVISTHLREKCNRISSPLLGITAKVMAKANEPVNLTDDLIFNDKINKGQDSDYVYRQLLQLQEENAKLKSENGKLLEKCVTKEGEASILRTQLKTCQVAVDNARLEKIKAQEKVQIEWTEKLSAANCQMHDIRTQLDFKNLEIISIKEKCKKLESTKVRLTQVTVANNDISSHRASSSFAQNESMMQSRRVRTSSSAVQTDDKAHFVALNKTCKPESSKLRALLPLILEPTASPHSLLDYNEKLSHRDIPYKCSVYSTFHRVAGSPAAPARPGGEGRRSLNLTTVYEDIVQIASGSSDKEPYFNVFNAVKNVLINVLSRLETISQRMTAAFQKEMDEKYIESTSNLLDVSRKDLLKGRALYKEEQEILARRMTAILSYILESSSSVEMLNHFEQTTQCTGCFTETISKICSLLDSTSTASVHSGLVLSLSHTVASLSPAARVLGVVRCMVTCRAAPAAARRLLPLLRDARCGRDDLCPGTSAGNLNTDYDQGVLLYKKDSCYLQILLKQIEACLKCIESQDLRQLAAETAGDLLAVFSNLGCADSSLLQDKSRCDCQLVLVQVIVYALRICAVMLLNTNSGSDESVSLLSTCRCGVQLLQQCSLQDGELGGGGGGGGGGRLAHNEGHLIQFCEIMRAYEHSELYANMLAELAGTLQSTPEDMPPSFHRQPWLKSFESFSIAD